MNKEQRQQWMNVIFNITFIIVYGMLYSWIIFQCRALYRYFKYYRKDEYLQVKTEWIIK